MSLLSIILTNIVSLIVGTGGTILFLRPKLKEANANADKADIEADNYAYNSLVERLNNMEKLYTLQSNVVASLREQMLEMSKEKYGSEQRIVQVEAENTQLKKRIVQVETENTQLKKRVEGLEEELKAYRNTKNQHGH